MRAFVCTKYGDAKNLKRQEVPKPSPKPNEILVKIHVVSVNSWDWEMLSGVPIIRMMGPFKPPHRIMGADISGTVEAVGHEVTDFSIGDQVFGDVSDSGWGGFAEYVTGKAEHFAKMPDDLSFEDAATLPQAGLLGYQGVRKYGQVKPGDKVLINGAGGGAGMFAIQLAKLDGAEVTAIDHADKQATMRQFGADHVFDYEKTDYTKLDNKFDVIIDAVAQRSPKDYRKILAPNGTFVMMGGRFWSILSILFASRKNNDDGQKFKILAWGVNRPDLLALAQLVREKKVKIFCDKTFSFEQIPEAVQYVGDHHAHGKVIIKTD